MSCRNLLIYLDHTLQQRINSLFHYSLNPDGFLVLGPSETIGRSSELFRLIDGRHKIYRRPPVPARVVPEFLPVQVAARAGVSEAIAAATRAQIESDVAQKETDHLLLTRYAPASILIDENLNVVYFYGETSRYLEHAVMKSLIDPFGPHCRWLNEMGISGDNLISRHGPASLEQLVESPTVVPTSELRIAVRWSGITAVQERRRCCRCPVICREATREIIIMHGS